ncbi:hypothetical protein [uncultured Roseobacter sp.]|uniref:hypothetical protein n=1 Tax=uncultured Roseobacter sp. TaxID=114847 RepID=UPI002601F2E3|nr:hypothetical protein [uncultured Roseobacter sp.]
MPLIRTRADIDDHLGGPTPAEEKLMAHCAEGTFCQLGDGTLPNEGSPDPARHIRADVLRYLLLGGCGACKVTKVGVWASGAHITEQLDIDFITTCGPFRSQSCRFDLRIDSERTICDQISLENSFLAGWRAPGLVVAGSVFLRNISTAATVEINSATIGGQLDCTDAKFNAPSGHALNAQGVQVTGGVFLRNITAEATVDVNSATIGGQLDCTDAKFNAPSGHALNAQGAQVTAGVFLSNITAEATVAVNGATIGGQLDCTDAKFNAPSGHALNAQGARFTGDIFLRNITAEATVDVNGATIGGQLACNNAKFNATEGHALNAQGAKITGGVILDGITATATVALSSATIGGQLDCENAKFNATEGYALKAQGAKIDDNVILDGITATATVDLNSATIGGQLDCENAKFNATEGYALNAQSAKIEGGLIWRSVTHNAGAMTFDTAHFRVLADDATNWSDTLPLNFDGMTYDRIVGATDAETRLVWLAKGSNWGGRFYPQPYTHLAKVLREMGHDSDARAVLTERERLTRSHIRHNAGVLPNGNIGRAFESLWHDLRNLLRWTADVTLRSVVGYGHHPFRSLLWLLGFWLCATLLADRAWEAGDFAPNSDVIQTSPDWVALAASDTPNPAKRWAERPPPVTEHTARAYVAGQDWATFNALAYAADVVIPIIDLGQTSAWAPSTERGPWGWWLWVTSFGLVLGGWIVTALGAAAITGIIRRD